MWLSSSSSKRSAKSTSSPQPTSPNSSASRATSPGSALAEVLRKNPFRAASRESVVIDQKEDESVQLNKDLLVLADFYPDVNVEVFRELLVRFDGDSRLPLCVEQLYKYKTEWARGRWSVPPRDPDHAIPVEEQFRTKTYTDAVKRTVTREFSSLNTSAIDAVLAEVNNSYTNARPTLQRLANKTWKSTFTGIFRKRKSLSEPSSTLLDKSKLENGTVRFLATGCPELDQELARLFFVAPALPLKGRDQLAIDLELAEAINLQEAEDAGALYECKVCYNDITFENLSACSQDGHVVCLDCVRRTLNEALFGQGWARSIDVGRATLKCLASDDCQGAIPAVLVQRSLSREKSASEVWSKFEERLADHSLQASAMPLARCPYCPYAEADRAYHDIRYTSTLRWRLRRPRDISTLGFILLLELLPALLFVMIPLLVLFPKTFTSLFYTALGHLALGQRTTRFVCRRESCARKSCLECLKTWHDPHICREPLIISLRTTVEAARTAAVKRTCPRCATSFVKSSGCNKLTCVCGYSMCYLCRKNIGKTGVEGGEGYRHFCEHFRPVPGQKCLECDKCDLYHAEDEDAEVRQAGEEAERLWREREGMVDVKGLEDAVGNIAGQDDFWTRLLNGKWSVQGTVDWVVERCIVLESD